MLYFYAWLVNNLPLLLEVEVPDNKKKYTIVLKYPVPQLKQLFKESVRFVLTRN